MPFAPDLSVGADLFLQGVFFCTPRIELKHTALESTCVDVDSSCWMTEHNAGTSQVSANGGVSISGGVCWNGRFSLSKQSKTWYQTGLEEESRWWLVFVLGFFMFFFCKLLRASAETVQMAAVPENLWMRWNYCKEIRIKWKEVVGVCQLLPCSQASSIEPRKQEGVTHHERKSHAQLQHGAKGIFWNAISVQDVV